MQKAKFDHLKEEKQLNELWNSVYKERRKKVSKNKAIICANARVYAEALKIFNTKEKTNIFERAPIQEEKNYKTYRVGNNSIVITTDEKVLNKFPMAERKGKLKSMDDAFEREIFSKLVNDYEVQLHPDMYYVINGDE